MKSKETVTIIIEDITYTAYLNLQTTLGDWYIILPTCKKSKER